LEAGAKSVKGLFTFKDSFEMTLRTVTRAIFATTATDTFWHPELPEFGLPGARDRLAEPEAAAPSRPMAGIAHLFGSLRAA
jgi:hypothetical protein